MRRKFLLMGLFVIILISSVFSVSALHHNTNWLRWFAGGSFVRGSSATLRTSEDGAGFNIHTEGLNNGDAVTVWWVIFNHPEKCTHGVMGFRCGERDLTPFGGSSAVGSSVLYADGAVIRGSGGSNFNGFLNVNDASGALFGNGLTNPQGADIHFVVKTHGRIIRGLVSEQISTFGGGCNNAPAGTGTSGPNTCEDLQFVVFEQ